MILTTGWTANANCVMRQIPLPPEHRGDREYLHHQRVLDCLRAEYLEMPGMKLRIQEVQRLCAIEETMCKLVLEALVTASFLCLKSDGTYVRLTEGSSPRPNPLKSGLTPTPIVMISRRAS
jgi:hypothetical protein